MLFLIMPLVSSLSVISDVAFESLILNGSAYFWSKDFYVGVGFGKRGVNWEKNVT